MVIDEWDAPIREKPEIEREYLLFLQMLFKSSAITPRIFASVYMTGILPIKKDGSQSAISDFEVVIELKWNKSAEGAIAQILDRKYPDVLKDYGSDIMLVGINYDKNAAPGQRKHTCRIIRYTKAS